MLLWRLGAPNSCAVSIALLTLLAGNVFVCFKAQMAAALGFWPSTMNPPNALRNRIHINLKPNRTPPQTLNQFETYPEPNSQEANSNPIPKPAFTLTKANLTLPAMNHLLNNLNRPHTAQLYRDRRADENDKHEAQVSKQRPMPNQPLNSPTRCPPPA